MLSERCGSGRSRVNQTKHVRVARLRGFNLNLRCKLAAFVWKASPSPLSVLAPRYPSVFLAVLAVAANSRFL